MMSFIFQRVYFETFGSCVHWKIQVNFEFHATFHSSYFFSKDRRDSGDDHRSSPASSSTSNVAIAAAAAAAAAAAQFNATVSTSEASSDRGTPPRGKHTFILNFRNCLFYITYN